MSDAPDPILSFAEFELDTAHRRLSRSGEPITLNAKAFDLLAFLATNRNRILTKDEILDEVWNGQFVEESNLVVQVSNLRKALGEQRNSPRFLLTIPGKGYKFVGDPQESEFIVESQTISEVSIERTEVTSGPSTGWWWTWKRIAMAAGLLVVGGLVTAAVVGFRSMGGGYASPRTSQAYAWTDPANRIEPRQLTANGNINVAAISPDGSFYAYTNEGEERSGLWVAAVDGSQKVEVLAPAEIEFDGLTFSKDGRHIYYTVRDRANPRGALFRVPTFGGRSEKVLSDICCAPTLSPDGSQLAFMRVDAGKGTTSLIIADIKDAAVERVLSTREKEIAFNDNAASWSPDGSKIAVGAKHEVSGENALLLFDVASGRSEVFGGSQWNFIRRVEWMPDGSGIFVNAIGKDSWQDRQVWIVEYPSGNTRQITSNLDRYGRETVSVSGDGSKMIGVRAQTVSNIFVSANEKPEQLKNITNNSIGKNDGNFNSLAWTSDGRLVFMRFFDQGEALFITDADGNGTRQITPNTNLVRSPVVTANDRHVVYSSQVNGGEWNVWRIDLDGSNPKQLTLNGGVDPSVTPDGQTVFYQYGGSIWKIGIDGGEPVRMAVKASRAVEVSPDGKLFACFYRPEAGGKLKLAVFSIDGGEPLHQFEAAADLLYPKLRWTPDGTALVYAFYNSTAWKQPLSGGPAQKFLEVPGETISALAWSKDGRRFAMAYGRQLRDVVLFSPER